MSIGDTDTHESDDMITHHEHPHSDFEHDERFRELQRRWMEWIPDEASLTLVTRPEEEHWVALILEHDVIGQGPTQNLAVSEAFQLLAFYLFAFFKAGKSYAESIRRVPFGKRLRIHASMVFGFIIRTASREREYRVPAGQVEAPEPAFAC